MMKITFPYMGSTIIYQKLLELLGYEVVMPPRPTQRTISLGVKYSPEFACFPYKVIMGSYIEALEAGADTIVTSGGNGPCRAGFYSEVHLRTLRSLGYNVEMIVFDNFYREPLRFIRKILRLKGKDSWNHVARVVSTTYRMAHAIDSLQKMVEYNRPYELERGSFTKVFDTISRRFEVEVKTVADVRRLQEQGLRMIEAIPVRKPPQNQRIRIGVVGEIYMVIESSINMGIAELLNNLGCEVSRSMYISEWVDHVLPSFLGGRSEAAIAQKGARYLEIPIGGHARNNIGNMVHYREQGFDGIVHLMPFACLPELVTQSMAPVISGDLGIPILTLAIDEQTGTANILTRLEAFIELVKNNKMNCAHARETA